MYFCIDKKYQKTTRKPGDEKLRFSYIGSVDWFVLFVVSKELKLVASFYL